MNNIEEYRKQFLEEIRFIAEHDGTDPESSFIEKTLSYLEEIGDVIDPIPMSIEMRGRNNRILSFDAYAYDEADGALVLIASDFTNVIDSKPTLTNTRIDELINRMQNFVDEIVNGNISRYCDDSDTALILAKEFKKKIGNSLLNTEILRFKYIIISNAILSNRVKDISRGEFLDRPVHLSVWTLERFYEAFVSKTSEIIEIDTVKFNCEGIPFLKADLGEKCPYDAYLGILPGQFLADIYYEYGSKLLQGNVRAFLTNRTEVNKGIRNTIINHPENFFTYNNGVAIVARSVKFSDKKDLIVSFKDFQIINGGQTTASLSNSIRIKEEAKKNIESLYVPMKLTVLNIDDDMSDEQEQLYSDITKTISSCANNQNAIKPADFFSNHPFHVKMEQFSRKVMAPPVGGNPYQTRWFYERSRGKWEQEQMKLEGAEINRYREMYPKKQVVNKEKFAKCYNSVLMNPHSVCKSVSDNFKLFSPYITDIYNNSPDIINEEFFKKGICSVIIFDSLDSLVGKASWYPKGGNKAQIVPYAISKLISLLPKGLDLDWASIWKKQMLYPELAEELMKIAFCAHEFLMKKAAGGIVRTISRNASTWSEFKEESYTLSRLFVKSLISIEESKDADKAARRVHKFNSDVDIAVEVFKHGVNYWMRIYNDLVRESILSYGDCSFIKGIADYINKGNLPSSAQCKRLVKILDKAEDKGYIIPD